VAFPRATDGVSAAVEAQRALADHAWPKDVEVRVRMGLHTGEPWEAREGYVGMDVHRAARIAHVGNGGQVLLSETTTALVLDELPEGVSLLDLGRHLLKDIHRPEHIRQLVVEGLPVEFPPLTSLEALPATELRQPRPVGECPYQGLAAFREADAQFFYGREGFTERLHEAVSTQPLVAVIVGSSGSGKSSAVYAGLLPRLRQDGGWLIAAFRPGSQPFQALARALLSTLEPELSETDSLIESHKLGEALEGGELPLNSVLSRSLDVNPGAERMLLVVDQFEELYTLCPEREARQRFKDELLAAVGTTSAQRQLRFVLLLTMRADFMGQALAHRPFADALQQAALLMGPMTREELRSAVEKPAEKQGAVFETGLVERILDDVGDEPGNLPLLEFALTLLWEGQTGGWLTHDDYEALGCVEGALASYADGVYDELDQSKKQGTRRIFIQLVRPGKGTEDTRRVATFAELGEQHWELVQHLADKRLVVTGRDASSGDETTEVVHEALIQRWGLLREWMAEDRIFRTWQETLRVALWGWETSDRDKGALLRGLPLTEAKNWLMEREIELNPAEKAFIQASLAERETRQAQALRTSRIMRALQVILAVAALVAMALAFVAFNARSSALREAAVNRSLAMAASAEKTFEAGGGDLALTLAIEAVRMDNPPPESVRALYTVAGGTGTRAILTGHGHAVLAAAISPDGQTALSGSCQQLDNSETCTAGELIEWDLETNSERRRWAGHEDWVTTVAYSPDGAMALTGSADGTILLWDMTTGDLMRQFEGHEAGVNSIAFSPDGQTALSASDDTTLILWRVSDGHMVRRLEGHEAAVTSADFSPGGETAVSGSADATLILWDVATGASVHRFEGHASKVFDVAFALDGQAIMSVGNDLSLRLWDPASGIELNEHMMVSTPEHLAVSPDGRTALYNLDFAILSWDIKNWMEASERLMGHTADVNALAIGPDGRLALSGAADGTLRLWNLKGPDTFRKFDLGFLATAVTVSPDNKYLVIGGENDALVVWDIAKNEPIRHLYGVTGLVSPDALDISPDGRYVVAGTGKVFTDPNAYSLVMWELDTGEVRCRFEGHEYLLRSVVFSPDGHTILSGGQGMEESYGDLILWDAQTCQLIHRFETNEDITAIVFSSDGRQALTSSAYFSNVILWDVDSGQEIHRYVLPNDHIFDVAFGPLGKTALVAPGSGVLVLWDLETGEVVRRFVGHDAGVFALDISPDGLFVISGSDTGTIMLWDFVTGNQLRRFDVHKGYIWSVAFGIEGRTAYSVSGDGSLIEWQIAEQSLDEFLTWIQSNRYVRELNCEERAQYRIEPLCEE
jgi:WD40 repeat protein